MRILLLAAGYATRMHPLTLDKAKPLLEVEDLSDLPGFLTARPGLNSGMMMAQVAAASMPRSRCSR